MEAAALVLYGIWFAFAFGVRIALQVRHTGSSGVRGVAAGAGALEWLAGVLFVAGLACGVAAPLLALLGVVEPIGAVDGLAANALGVALAVSGIVLTFLAQLAMGDDWRIGVDPEERTGLVTDGPFRLVRNPIYSAMLPAVLGLGLMVPSAVSLVGLLTVTIGLELQVRAVEEPYLLRTHGRDYADYAARVGRFIPGIGRRPACDRPVQRSVRSS
ncbi:MAG TPA: isoprenylcysteine carboxylmethyltransferase family protein [Solirubrobacterales bacterium]|nr:isoprenylcysteine carboxylmethyltransferase family protein [Solirubrobacterales bacterium]